MLSKWQETVIWMRFFWRRTAVVVTFLSAAVVVLRGGVVERVTGALLGNSFSVHTKCCCVMRRG